MNQDLLLYQRKEECCGCTACYAVCPTRSIEMVEDEEGFLYPIVRQKTCLRCGLCERVCPMKKHND